MRKGPIAVEACEALIEKGHDVIFGNNILDMEVNSDNRKLAPYFGAGFAFMIALVVVCVYSGAYYNDALDLGKVLIGVGAILCPLLAITCTFGILSLAGTRINSLLFVMPFLIMGVGTKWCDVPELITHLQFCLKNARAEGHQSRRQHNTRYAYRDPAE
ncbi:hypothetical protein OESDEN_06747 [Oesophagostomum dentatum]|uniref:SSD domain-containing protein n=1 Tax=Oesophagostomum dentatum TaxID=61180 RepID=A0A0B1TB21_OESDE|nr:hypothetical protein OESDEN_06747 [Oesophagostomum dentatum]